MRPVELREMTASPTEISPLSTLSESELRALVAGAAWYAKYHQRMIADQADDRSAAGIVRREHFRDLFAGLRKLGVRMRVPDGIEHV